MSSSSLARCCACLLLSAGLLGGALAAETTAAERELIEAVKQAVGGAKDGSQPDLAALANLIEANQAAVSGTDKRGDTALAIALRGEQWAVARLLVAAEAPLDRPDRQRWYPLHRAIAGEQAELVDAMLRRQPPLNVFAREGQTALSLAIVNDDLELVRRLLEAGADPLVAMPNENPVLERYPSPFRTALQSNRPQAPAIVAALLPVVGRRIDLRERFIADPTLLADSFSHYRGEVFLQVLPFVDPDLILDADAQTRPVHRAVLTNNPAIFTALQEAQADLNAQDARGRSALMQAIRSRLHLSVRTLIEAGVDLELADSYGQRALHMAVKINDVDAVLLLVDGGADIHAVNRQDWTPLHVAAANGHPGMCDYLLSKGARLNPEDPAKISVLAAAQERGRFDTAAWLAEQGATGGLPPAELILQLARANRFDRVAEMLADPTLPPQATVNLLRWAAGKNHLQAARMAIEAGADVNAHAEDQHPAISLAAQQGNRAMVELLLANQADPDELGPDGETALHRAVTNRASLLRARRQTPVAGIEDQLAVIEALIAGDATLGPEVLPSAVSGGDAQVLQLLFGAGLQLGAMVDNPNLAIAAVQSGSHEVLEILQGRGVSLPVRSHGGELLHAAVVSRSGPMVEAVLAAGVALDQRQSLQEPSALHRAAESGTVPVVQALLEAGADIDAIIAFSKSEADEGVGLTPMMLALQRRRSAIARLMLEAGADPTIADPKGATPLHLAVYYLDQLLVQKLLERGVAVNAATTQPTPGRYLAGETPLHLAARATGNPGPIIELLAKHGARLEAQNADGDTPYALARRLGQSDAAEALERVGADTAVIDPRVARAIEALGKPDGHRKIRELLDEHPDALKKLVGKEVLVLHQYAGRGNEAMVVDLLDRGATIDARDSSGATPLMYAVAYGQVATTRLLLDRGADANARSRDDRGQQTTPLLIAVGYNPHGGAPRKASDQAQLVSALLAGGADPNATVAGQTPALGFAAARGNAAAVEALLTGGATIAADQQGHSLLTQFIYRGDLPGIKALVKHGAPIDIVDQTGRSPLMLAARRGRRDIVAYLLAQGADATRTDKDGYTAVHHAEEGAWDKAEKDAIVQLLLDAGAQPTGIDTAVWQLTGLLNRTQNEDEVSACIEANQAVLKDWPALVQSPVLEAIQRRYPSVVSRLLQLGVPVDVVSRHGYTPLALAVLRRDADLVRLLVDHGADVTFKNRGELTALDLAKKVKASQIIDILETAAKE